MGVRANRGGGDGARGRAVEGGHRGRCLRGINSVQIRRKGLEIGDQRIRLCNLWRNQRGLFSDITLFGFRFFGRSGPALLLRKPLEAAALSLGGGQSATDVAHQRSQWGNDCFPLQQSPPQRGEAAAKDDGHCGAGTKRCCDAGGGGGGRRGDSGVAKCRIRTVIVVIVAGLGRGGALLGGQR